MARTVTNLPSRFVKYRSSIRSVLINTDVSVRFVNCGEDQSRTVSFEHCYHITASLGHAAEPTCTSKSRIIYFYKVVPSYKVVPFHSLHSFPVSSFT